MNTDATALTADHRDFYSTNLNHRIKSIADLTKRIAYSLGWPQVNVETHAAQVYDSIAIACEMFTKYAGYTEEYLIFDSDLYHPAKGLRMDKLMTFTPELSATIEYLDEESDMSIGNMFLPENDNVPFTINSQADKDRGVQKAPAGYDPLMLNYRKVIDIFAFEEGSTAGVNTLFTIEQTLAQQTYFSYAMGKYGFDLVSWYTLKEWLDTRKKLLGQSWHVRFDDRTQRMYIIPNPAGPNRARFYGLVGCYVERRLADVIKEIWVYKYSLALTKIALGRIRGKYANTALFGGGAVNAQDVLAEGNAEKDVLEEQLYTGAAGIGDAPPPRFFVG
jgi:hypothetical protein